MKKFWNYLVAVSEALCRARTAAELSRRGYYQLAREIMQK